VKTSDKEMPASEAKSTHAVDILAFVEAQEISTVYFETPYYLAPVPGGEKVYALLRETLHRTRKIGIAYVVIHARQHLAALIPDGQSLVLNTLRWTSETGSDEGVPVFMDDFDAEFLMEPKPRGLFACQQDRHAIQPAFQTDAATLAEVDMKPKKIEEIVLDDLFDGLLEDEEAYDDAYLASALRLRRHTPDGYAIRRAGATSRHRRGMHTRVRLRGTGR
jgi:DNA end-binding protein Ku